MQFDWDNGNAAKCAKHGLTLNWIEAFFRLGPLVAPDPMHSVLEQRFIAVGSMPDGRPAFVAFCWRGAKIRKHDVTIAKNYLNEQELAALNNLVEQYLVFA